MRTIGQSTKYTLRSIIDKDEIHAIEIYLRNPPKLHCITLHTSCDDDITEHDQDLPPGVVSFFMNTPIVRLYVNKEREKRATVYHPKEMELWDGPVSSIAEFRKKRRVQPLTRC